MNRTIITLPDHCDAIALCGGPYSNFAAVEAFLATTSGLPRFCLGDLGGPGPHPDRTIARIRESYVVCMQGNYDYAVGHGERDCGCGYVDPRDREYAQVSYDYTAANTSEANKAWLRSLPAQMLIEWRRKRILLVHGSPDSVSDFVWESETDDAKDRCVACHRERASDLRDAFRLAVGPYDATRILVQRRRARPTGARCNAARGLRIAAFRQRRDDADSEPRSARL